MITLNLETKTKEHEIIKHYLEQNVSEILANKINNGVQIIKDTLTLINKKDLDGFMNYANQEARKLVENGANSACVEDKTVFGWATHYFEEDSIEGKLYNIDGTEYSKPKPKMTKTISPSTKKTSKEQPKQTTLFDWFEQTEETKSDDELELENAKQGKVLIDGEFINYEDFDYEPTEEEIDIASKFVAETEIIDKGTGEILDNKLVITLNNIIEDLEVRL